MASLLDQLDHDYDGAETREVSPPSPLVDQPCSAVMDSGPSLVETSTGGAGDDSGIDLDTDGDSPMTTDPPTPGPSTDDNRNTLSADDAPVPPTESPSDDSEEGSESDAESSLNSPTVRFPSVSS